MKNGVYDYVSITCSTNTHVGCFHTDNNNSGWCSCDCHDEECTCNVHYFSRGNKKKKEDEEKIKILIGKINWLLDSCRGIPNTPVEVREKIITAQNFIPILKELLKIE